MDSAAPKIDCPRARSNEGICGLFLIYTCAPAYGLLWPPELIAHVVLTRSRSGNRHKYIAPAAFFGGPSGEVTCDTLSESPVPAD